MTAHRNKRKHILWLTHYIPYPPVGGLLQRGYHLLAEVSKRHDVTLIALSQKRHLGDGASVGNAIDVLGKFCRSIDVHGIPSERSQYRWYKLVLMCAFTRLPYTAHWTRSPSMKERVSKFLQTARVDMAHFDTIGLAEYLPASRGIPVVVNHHNIESHMMKRRLKYEPNLLKRLYFRLEACKLGRYEKINCPLFQENLTVSELDRSYLISSIPGLKVQVVPNGTDTRYFQPVNASLGSAGLIFVGGLSWYPNRDAMLFFCEHVWPLIRKADPRATLTIIGRDPPSRLKRLTGNDQRIRILGFVSDIRQHVGAAAVYVCPIRDGGGTRLKILDALAMGKAVVATTMACEGLQVIDGQHVLKADTPEEFCAGVLEILRRPELQRRLGQEGRRLVEQEYSWHTIGQRLAGLYERVIDTH